MRVRVRKIGRRLTISLEDAERVNGRPRNERIALGAIAVGATARDRATFWQAIPERLDRLSNRIGPADREAILAALAWRVPKPTAEELIAERPPLTLEQAAGAVSILARAARIASAGVRRGVEALPAAMRRGQARLSTALAVAAFPRSIPRLGAARHEAMPRRRQAPSPAKDEEPGRETMGAEADRIEAMFEHAAKEGLRALGAPATRRLANAVVSRVLQSACPRAEADAGRSPP